MVVCRAGAGAYQMAGIARTRKSLCPDLQTFTSAIPSRRALPTAYLTAWRCAPASRVKVNFAGRNMIAFVHRVHDDEPRDFEVKDIGGVVDAGADLRRTAHRPGTLHRVELHLVRGGGPGHGAPLGLLALEARSRDIAFAGRGLPAGHAQRRSSGPCTRASWRRAKGAGSRISYSASPGAARRKSTSRSPGVSWPRATRSYTWCRRYRSPPCCSSACHGVFGEDLIVYHSHLTPNQRLRNWVRFYRGEARIAVGTRSAVFLQCPALGMIVIDEEHDGSYKEHSTPRYNARRLALYRSKTENALVVMGSATPAVETLYACERGLMKLHTLTRRFGGAALPEIEIVKIRLDQTPAPDLDRAEAQHQAGRGRGAPGHLPAEPPGVRAHRHLRALRVDRRVPALQHRHELSPRRRHALPLLRPPARRPPCVREVRCGGHGQGRLRHPAGRGDHRVRVQGLPHLPARPGQLAQEGHGAGAPRENERGRASTYWSARSSWPRGSTSTT